MHTTDNMPNSTLVIADNQGKYFKDHLQKHHILSLFNSWGKIENLFPKYQDKIPSFDMITIQIGSNNCSSRDNEEYVLLHSKNHKNDNVAIYTNLTIQLLK